jgi:hypothetical protein
MAKVHSVYFFFFEIHSVYKAEKYIDDISNVHGLLTNCVAEVNIKKENISSLR